MMAKASGKIDCCGSEISVIFIDKLVHNKYISAFRFYRGNKNVTLTLSWNIIPNAGLLPSVNALGSHTFAFPSEYTTLRV